MHRRAFLSMTARTVMVASVSGIGPALAAGLPRLQEDDPSARALGYRNDAADVEKSMYPRFEPGQTCANCNLVQGSDKDAWRPCPIFAGKLVNARGWCNAWVARSG
ncbi:MAG: high-potential iron-sulfur protein [Xanthomonadales bacterium]|nr:high-potential iron-sulfur protein [Xanthomonadales bacterium]